MLYWLVKMVLTPLLRFCYRIKVEGAENIPADGPVILASNHRSFLDSIFIPLLIRRRVTFVAKADYFDDPKTAWFFRGVGQIPIRREGGSASQRALDSAKEVLDGGCVFAIYPEGTRSRDGLLHRGHTGFARLALTTGAPVVPIGLIGTDEIQPVDQNVPRIFRTVTIRFGPLIDPARYANRGDDRLVARQIADEVMFEIRELTGYEYSDTYATREAEGIPAQEATVTPLVGASGNGSGSAEHDAARAVAS